MSKSKVEKLKLFQFHGINIKLLSNERKGEQAYFDLMRDLFDKDIIARVSSEKSMTLRTQARRTIVWRGNEYRILYGKITRFTMLEGEHWYNAKKKEIESIALPLQDIFPNGFETDYYFFPFAHRFFVRINSKVSLKAIENFLQLGLGRVVKDNEKFSITIIQSSDAIEQILNAPELNYLTVRISYTNDDIGDDAQELIDQLLKDGQIGELNATIKPDQHGSLDTNSKIVKGLLEISKENGTAEATIKNSQGQREKIITHDHPEKFTVEDVSEDNIISKLLFQVITKYRD